MDILYPRIQLARLPAMIGVSLLGALLAGLYGALHDQVSYSISPEYFTKLKFHQFSYANFGFHPRVFAAEVGFLASFWVGMIAAWLLARVGLTQLPQPERRTVTTRSFLIVFASTLALGTGGALLGVARAKSGDLSSWQTWERTLQLTDLPSFVIVAYLHNGSYLGGLIGFIAAAIYVRKRLSSHTHRQLAHKSHNLNSTKNSS
jgi:hypothetical protein